METSSPHHGCSRRCESFPTTAGFPLRLIYFDRPGAVPEYAGTRGCPPQKRGVTGRFDPRAESQGWELTSRTPRERKHPADDAAEPAARPEGGERGEGRAAGQRREEST